MSVGVTGAIIGGAALAGGASIAGGLASGSAAKDAAQVQAAAQQHAIDVQQQLAREGLGILKDQNAQAQATLAPFVAAQTKALGGLQGFTDPTSEYYNQQRDLSTMAIQRQLAAQGLLRSRSQGDALSQLELGLSGQRLSVLQQLAGTGAGQAQAALMQQYGGEAAGMLGGLGQQVGSSIAGIGATQAQGQLSAAQATIGGFQGFGNAIQGGVGNLAQLSMLKTLLGKG